MPDYTDSADLTSRFDIRSICQLVSDTGVPVQESALSADGKVIAALDDAEGEVAAMLLVGGRYNADDLAALTGTSLAYLKYIICNIAMLHLLGRRPTVNAKLYESLTKLRESHIKALQDGSAIFGGNVADEAAARPVVDGVSHQDHVNTNSIRIRKPRYFAVSPYPVGRQ
jgi:hypothetical protein